MVSPKTAMVLSVVTIIATVRAVPHSDRQADEAAIRSLIAQRDMEDGRWVYADTLP
jgi:hypothetical protein